LDVLSRPESGFPSLIKVVEKLSSKVEPGTVFSLKDSDVPVVAVRLIHPCKHMKVSVVDVESKKTLGLISNGDHKLLGQHDQAPDNLKTDIPWSTGKYIDAGKLVDVKDGGKYKLVVEGLRPFANEKDARAWQKWESVEFSIDRTKTPPTGAKLDDAEPFEPLLKLERASRQWLALRDKMDNSVLPVDNNAPALKM